MQSLENTFLAHFIAKKTNIPRLIYFLLKFIAANFFWLNNWNTFSMVSSEALVDSYCGEEKYSKEVKTYSFFFRALSMTSKSSELVPRLKNLTFL